MGRSRLVIGVPLFTLISALPSHPSIGVTTISTYDIMNVLIFQVERFHIACFDLVLFINISGGTFLVHNVSNFEHLLSAFIFCRRPSILQ